MPRRIFVAAVLHVGADEHRARQIPVVRLAVDRPLFPGAGRMRNSTCSVSVAKRKPPYPHRETTRTMIGIARFTKGILQEGVVVLGGTAVQSSRVTPARRPATQMLSRRIRRRGPPDRLDLQHVRLLGIQALAITCDRWALPPTARPNLPASNVSRSGESLFSRCRTSAPSIYTRYFRPLGRLAEEHDHLALGTAPEPLGVG